ncbi:phosphoenolpyruvate-utilizing protein [Mycobacterium sp. SMC-8]|uniref:PEP-utilizing enzyme n=1 Tax=Mycobacterium sp. SMC-8 TaxID=2857060 RepID=UPI0021B164C8|nr:PEP-utilizing enzyme [Mycobacterium sp. SMC-8]UXA11484.1 phosphoenolpyruvate-utilizing protein [Mycobacterium sp. SMC-8]
MTASPNGTTPHGTSAPDDALDLGRDPRHSSSAPDTLWTTVNVAEAIPGVITPLGWSIWGPASDMGMRKTFAAFGVLTGAEAQGPAGEHDRVMSVFYGRPVLRADFFLAMGERLPGTSGADVAESLFAATPEDYVSRPERRYYLRAALRVPVITARAPGLIKKARAETDQWWRTEVHRVGHADIVEAQHMLEAAAVRFHHNAYLHMVTTFAVVQLAYDQLSALIEAAGVGGGLLSGDGDHEETRFVHDLWACSRNALDLTTFLDRHGYHGPNEGEISGRVWREDHAPLERMLASYAARGDDADPRVREEAFRIQREGEKRQLLASLSGVKRLKARAVLALAGRAIPLRGVGKVCFLQSLDVARAAARRIGFLVAEQGFIDDPEDIFFLTRDEIRDGRWTTARSTVEFRRRCHQEYQRYELPVKWNGAPQPRLIDTPNDSVEFIEGIGASPGVVEGPVRVVTEPDDIDIEEGEILVARTTDPSWAAIMFLSAGLVMDIGGALSHAAVVARELGIPCVANTGIGTRVLVTGDRCRVDGSTGRIEILERVQPSVNPI